LPGVAIRGGVEGHQDVALFNLDGAVTDSYLKHGVISSDLVGYITVAPGWVMGIIVKTSVVVAGDVIIYIEKNGVAFFNETLGAGVDEYAKTFDPTDHVYTSLDELACRIEGTAQNISVELKML